MKTRVVNKWNCEKHKYEPYIIPENWYITIHEMDMNKTINCAECGKEIKVGDSYTSKLIHTSMGIGYLVCRKCQDEEWKEYLKNKED